LLVSGSLDAITAPANAVAAAAELPNAHLLDYPDGAHDVMIWSPRCGVAVMQSFLNQPDRFDDSCVAALKVPPFTVS